MARSTIIVLAINDSSELPSVGFQNQSGGFQDQSIRPIFIR